MVRRLGKNHQVFCTTRNYREATYLAKIRNMQLISVGKHGGIEKQNKLSESINRMSSLSKLIYKESPDIAISFCSPEASRVSFGLGIKHIAFCNAPHSEAVMKLSLPLVQKLLIPNHIPKTEFSKYGIPKKDIISYKAMDEYLIIKNDKPSHSTVPTFDKSKNIILFRTYETAASYLPKTQTKMFPIIHNLATHFPNHTILVLGRYADQISQLKKEFGQKVKVIDKVVDSGEILPMVDLFIGSGGTMTSESALYGIPTISYDAIPNYDEKYLVKHGLVIRAKTPDAIIKAANNLLSSNTKRLQNKSKKLVNSMEDPYFKLLDVIKHL